MSRALTVALRTGVPGREDGLIDPSRCLRARKGVPGREEGAMCSSSNLSGSGFSSLCFFHAVMLSSCLPSSSIVDSQASIDNTCF